MVSTTAWIVFAQLVIFNPQSNGNENELTEFRQREFNAKPMLPVLARQLCVSKYGSKRHAERRNGRVIILGCGDRAELSEISSD